MATLSQEIGTSLPDNLISGSMKIDTISVTIEQNQDIKRGAVLGQKNPTVPATGTANGGNTGNGTMTALVSKRDTQDGVYTITITAAATDAGDFSVVNPNGQTLPSGTVAVAYVSDELNFIVNDGAADYVVGDSFTVTVVEGQRMLKLIDSGAGDGSEAPYCIAAEAIDSTATGTNADTVSVGYLSGQFNQRALTVGGTDTVDQHRAALRNLGIYLDDSVPAGPLDGEGA